MSSTNDDEVKPDSATPRNVALFWWVTLGSLATGLSVVSLVKTYFQRDVSGIIGIVLAKYAQMRDLIFDGIDLVLPDWHLSSALRTLVIVALLFVSVTVRTYYIANTQSKIGAFAVVTAIVSYPMFLLLHIAGLYIALKDGSVTPVLVASAVLIWAVRSFWRDTDVRISFGVFLLNAAACAAVALVLLALGGAI